MVFEDLAFGGVIFSKLRFKAKFEKYTDKKNNYNEKK